VRTLLLLLIIELTRVTTAAPAGPLFQSHGYIADTRLTAPWPSPCSSG